jgi:hypothetical protein
MRSAVFLGLLLLLPACADNSARFLIDPPAAATQTPVRVSTIEVREASLPGHAAAIEIAQQDEGGALHNLDDALWADDPVRAVTTALARSLDLATTATVAAEPWPLDEPAQARIDLRVERMLARADGVFELSGQYAIASPDGIIRERLVRFDILVTITTPGSAGIAAASGEAIARLAADIATTLRR